jgi:hypothetical protein
MGTDVVICVIIIIRNNQHDDYNDILFDWYSLNTNINRIQPTNTFFVEQ